MLAKEVVTRDRQKKTEEKRASAPFVLINCDRGCTRAQRCNNCGTALVSEENRDFLCVMFLSKEKEWCMQSYIADTVKNYDLFINALQKVDKSQFPTGVVEAGLEMLRRKRSETLWRDIRRQIEDRLRKNFDDLDLVARGLRMHPDQQK